MPQGVSIREGDEKLREGGKHGREEMKGLKHWRIMGGEAKKGNRLSAGEKREDEK